MLLAQRDLQLRQLSGDDDSSVVVHAPAAAAAAAIASSAVASTARAGDLSERPRASAGVGESLKRDAADAALDAAGFQCAQAAPAVAHAAASPSTDTVDADGDRPKQRPRVDHDNNDSSAAGDGSTGGGGATGDGESRQGGSAATAAGPGTAGTGAGSVVPVDELDALPADADVELLHAAAPLDETTLVALLEVDAAKDMATGRASSLTLAAFLDRIRFANQRSSGMTSAVYEEYTK